MNDVNLSSPDRKLVLTSDQAPVKAMSSFQAEGRNASDLIAPSAPVSQSAKAVYGGKPVSEAQKLQKQASAEREQLNQAVSQLNDYVQNVQRDLQFEVDNERGQTIVKVVDQQTQEVIRQIPDEVALRLADNLQQDEPLSLFDVKV